MIYRFTPLQPWNTSRRPFENQMTSNGRFTTFTKLTTWAATTTTTTPTLPVLKCTSKSNVFLPFTGPKISTWPAASWPTSANSSGSWIDVGQEKYGFPLDKMDQFRSIGPISENFRNEHPPPGQFQKNICKEKMAVFCMFVLKYNLANIGNFLTFSRGNIQETNIFT